MHRPLLWKGAALGLLLATGGCCKRAICDFKATPRHVCPNGQVRLQSDTGGNPVSITNVGTTVLAGTRLVGEWIVEGPPRVVPPNCSDSTVPDPPAPAPARTIAD